MKEILDKLTQHQTLTKKESAQILINITEERYNPIQIASFVTVFLMRSIAVDELIGFRNALMHLCTKVDMGDQPTIDVCGTGGDGKNTFNISTISAFVVAGAGYKVTKHGNRSVSSKCGSSDVLTSLGYQLTGDRDILKKQLDATNFCYLHAPFFHQALKSVAPIRKDLGLKTFFNMLGPLVNPAEPSHQLVGVFDLKLMRLYPYIFDDMGHQYTIVHGLDGYDEVSLTCDTKVISSNAGSYILRTEDLSLPQYTQQSIYGGDTIAQAKKIFLDILQNKSTDAQRDVILANSALESGRAYEVLKDVLTIQAKT